MAAIDRRSLPSSFQWSSSGVLISPHSDSHNIIAVKDPSAVNYNGQWYVAASTVNSSGAYGMEFLSFSNWSQANSATPVYADQTAIGGDAPGSYSSYNAIPWRLGMVTQTNSTC